MKTKCEKCKGETGNLYLLYKKNEYPNGLSELLCGDCLPDNIKRVDNFSYELTV